MSIPNGDHISFWSFNVKDAHGMGKIHLRPVKK
jgi:hypothetical protein